MNKHTVLWNQCHIYLKNRKELQNKIHAKKKIAQDGKSRHHHCQKYVCVCVCVCVCGHVYVVYEDTNLYNDMGMTQVLQGEGDL